MRPSGLNATAATGPRCPAEGPVDQMAVAGVPDPHDVFRESGDEGPAVRAPGQILDRVRRALEAEGGSGPCRRRRASRLASGPGPARLRPSGLKARALTPPARSARRPRVVTPVVRRNSPVCGPRAGCGLSLEAGEGLPVGTEHHVGEIVLLGPEREPILVGELPEIAPLPAAEVGLARGRPQQVEETAEGGRRRRRPRRPGRGWSGWRTRSGAAPPGWRGGWRWPGRPCGGPRPPPRRAWLGLGLGAEPLHRQQRAHRGEHQHRGQHRRRAWRSPGCAGPTASIAPRR